MQVVVPWLTPFNRQPKSPNCDAKGCPQSCPAVRRNSGSVRAVHRAGVSHAWVIGRANRDSLNIQRCGGLEKPIKLPWRVLGHLAAARIGKGNAETAPAGGHGDVAETGLVALAEFAGDIQAKPGTTLFGGEKRLENMLHHLPADAGAKVNEIQKGRARLQQDTIAQP